MLKDHVWSNKAGRHHAHTVEAIREGDRTPIVAASYRDHITLYHWREERQQWGCRTSLHTVCEGVT